MAELTETDTPIEVTEPTIDQPVDVKTSEAVDVPPVAAPPITIPVAPTQTAAHLTVDQMSAISAVDKAYGRR